jgi:hypothetical protein
MTTTAPAPPPPTLHQVAAPAPARPGGVVLVLQAGRTGRLSAAVRAAADAGCPLHLVVPAPRSLTAWALIAAGPAARSGGQATGAAVDQALRTARAAGVHVEVHPTAGRPHRLAAGIAAVTGGEVIS